MDCVRYCNCVFQVYQQHTNHTVIVFGLYRLHYIYSSFRHNSFSVLYQKVEAVFCEAGISRLFYDWG